MELVLVLTVNKWRDDGRRDAVAFLLSVSMESAVFSLMQKE